MEVIPRTEHKARKKANKGDGEDEEEDEIDDVNGGLEETPDNGDEVAPDALESVPGEPLLKRKRRIRKKKRNKENRERRKIQNCKTDEEIEQQEKDMLSRLRRHAVRGPPVKHKHVTLDMDLLKGLIIPYKLFCCSHH